MSNYTGEIKHKYHNNKNRGVRIIMNDTLIAVMACLMLICAFVFEGLSHGWRAKYSEYVYTNRPSSDTRKLSSLWHSFNTLFIGFLGLSIYFMGMGSDYSYTGTFDLFWLYDISWVVFHVILARFCLFDYMYNLARGSGLLYVGTTALSDKFIRKYLSKLLSPTMRLSIKAFTLAALILSMMGDINLF